ncbi:hypothetical protein BG015_005617 [Linnemannia schmuckeri]|uniref:Uncharacterized protein n=1 Tax=Linnemannia schmuckeri TaxID=64567 RepID=A0A9P5S3C7_9FUNG|nr:hypothetical protein BG015_005617 [Linnemannia schmuckeri]
MADSDTFHTMPVLPEEGSRQSRRPTRLPPSRVYTINTSHQELTTGPKTAPIGLSSSPFRHSNHSTGNIITTNINPHSDIVSRARSFSASSNNNNNNKNGIVGGRSRSFSASNGGVVPRSRADSEASRLALEAMIQKRLDRITQRLDDFNFQSHELYTRTETLAKSFYDNAKRLYKVEDHLLRVQGKPGLSDAYLENAGPPQQRRLTHDLEELRMGVKTLRKKFQVAGSVASTVEWWKRLKENAQDSTVEDGGNGSNPAHAENNSSLEEPTVSSPSSSPMCASTSPVVVSGRSKSSSSSLSSFSRTVSRKEGQALQKIMTTLDATATVCVTPSASTQDTVPSPDSSLPHGAAAATQGLRSPPLTPKNPPTLLGSFMQRGHLDDLLHTPTNIKARPLSVIHDLEEPPFQLPLSPPSTAWAKESKDTTIAAPASLADDMIHFDKEDHATPLHSAASSTIQNSPFQSNNHNNDNNESRPVFLEIFTPPSPAVSVSASAFAFASASAETAETVSRSTEPKPELEIPGVENAGCEDKLQGNNKPAEQTSGVDEGDVKDTADDLADEEVTALDTISSELSQAAVETPAQEQENDSGPVLGTNLDSDNKDDLLPSSTPHCEVSKGEQSAQEALITEKEAKDTWVQFLWKILIRLEYFILGTAVLGAMMPESFLALCTGFLSAVLYGALVIRHRILAAPESEAPRPPVGTKGFGASSWCGVIQDLLSTLATLSAGHEIVR